MESMQHRMSDQQQQESAVQQNHQLKVELVEADSSNSINEASHYERRCSPSGQQLQLGIQQSLEPGCQVKATKSVLFDTRSTTHAHNKKVQSGNDYLFFSHWYYTARPIDLSLLLLCNNI